ncbi:MAG: shikimate dehydrogenase family protein, partial [Chitinophagales bacterium]
MANSKKTYGLIGKKLDHSFSTKYFAEKFAKENISNAEYLNFPLEKIEDIRSLLKKEKNLAGLNITIPYKRQILPFLNKLSPEAKKVGAVNTIEFKDGLMIGHNTDVIGFEQSLTPLLNKKHKTALLFGTGGASKAVEFVLKKLKIPFKIVSRTKTKHTLTLKEINKRTLLEHEILINTTPLGTFPKVDECLDITYQGLNAHHLVYDLVYNPEETLFLQKAKKQGSKIKNGREMLELQAEASWAIW